MKWLLLIIICLAGLILVNIIWEQVMRWWQLPRSPKLSSLFTEVQNSLKKVRRSTWMQYSTDFETGPTHRFETSTLAIDVWRTTNEPMWEGTTYVITSCTHEYPWTLTFCNDILQLASIGNTHGAQFKEDELSVEDSIALNKFHEHMLKHLT